MGALERHLHMEELICAEDVPQVTHEVVTAGVNAVGFPEIAFPPSRAHRALIAPPDRAHEHSTYGANLALWAGVKKVAEVLVLPLLADAAFDDIAIRQLSREPLYVQVFDNIPRHRHPLLLGRHCLELFVPL